MTYKLTPLEVSKLLKDFVLEHIENDLDKTYIISSFEIIEYALKKFNELEKSLRKNATREKAKMLDKYIKKFCIPEKRWRDVHYVIESNERWASMYRDLLKDTPQSNETKYPTCKEDEKD